jgi:iron-sulfur cluster repair protein YtfE (RIC family)
MKTTATSLLKKQHRKVEATFKKILAAAGTVKATPLVTELATDLASHMVIEQEIFYPAVIAVKKDLILESFEEHACAQFELTRLLQTSAKDESFKARVTTLKELIQHHVEEEEDDLFPKVDKALGTEKLVALAARMQARFDELVEAGYASALTKAKAEQPKPLAEKVKASRNGARHDAQ